MTSPYCQLCGYQPPDPVAYHERTAELAAAREEIARLRELCRGAYVEGHIDGCGLGPHTDDWESSAAFRLLVPAASSCDHKRSCVNIGRKLTCQKCGVVVSP